MSKNKNEIIHASEKSKIFRLYLIQFFLLLLIIFMSFIENHR